ncbi:Ig-like domain repeat protein [Demequina soli]|uniref:Ig-like domain repeat protein n=1 Tax=Demequina soli TaxID=1638987 RepID=UPI000784B140|nr:Ig-like domain repeat protein [Demequina soli]
MTHAPRRTAHLLVSATVALALTLTTAAASTASTASIAASTGEAVDGRVLDVIAETPGESTPAHVLVEDDGTVTPVTGDALDGIDTGATVSTTVEDGQVRAATVLEPTAATATVAAHRAYVVTVADPAATGAVPLATARADALAAADYWVREARGAIGTFTVAGSATMTVTDTCATVDAYSLWTQAAALFPNVSFDAGTNHLLVYTPTSCTWDYAGIATVGAGMSGGYVHIPEPLLSATVHELGHNLGLGHADLIWGDPFATSSGFAEYYAAYGPMAASIGSLAPATLPAQSRRFLDLPGYADGTQAITVTRGSGAAKVITLADSASGTGVTAATFGETRDGERFTYTLEYRAGTGEDATAFFALTGDLAPNGVTARYEPGVTVTWGPDSSELYQFAQKRAGGVLDTSFQAGEQFVDPTGLFTLDVVSIADGVATVKVTAGTTAAASSTAMSAPAVYAGSWAVAHATVTSSHAVGGGTVTFYVDGAKRGTYGLSGGSVDAPLSKSLAVGTHQVRAVYSGAAGVSGSSATRTLTVKAKVATTTKATATKVAYGTHGKVTVTVVGSPTPTGKVTVTAGTWKGTATLASGKATIATPATWAPGTRTLTVAYGGSAKAKASATTVRATVIKATPTLSSSATTAVRRGAKATLVVTVASPVAAESGAVRLYVGTTAVSGKVTLTRSGSVYTAKVTTSALPQGRIAIRYYGNTYLKERRSDTRYVAR